MVGIDTNILVRFFAQDDPIQTALAQKLFDRYSGQEYSIFINNMVICELIWVLNRLYKYNKSQIIILLKDLLSTLEFAFEDQAILVRSIIDYENQEADFADILIGHTNLNKECKTTFTFDKKASQLSEFEWIG